MVNYYDMFTTTDDMFTVAVTEFDDSLEGDLKRQCKEADRTGVIPDCTWMTRDCRQRWRAKCYHVRMGGLLTSPPPTTMPESNTTSIVITTSGTTMVNNDVDEATDDMFTDAVTEFDDSPEGDLKRQCKEADRTGVIPDCTWMTRDCRERWRAKCYHVRTGGLLTSPPPTTMIMPESNTTTIVITTSGTTLENQNDQSHSISSTEKMSSESINGSGQAISHLNFIKLNVFSGEDNLASNILSLLFLFIVYHQ